MSSIADLLEGSGEFGRDLSFKQVGDFVQGTVSDNTDSKFPGMVKVEFTAWKSTSNICEWMPLLRGFAGKEYGSYVVPEIGDIVLVGFIGADKKRPFVLGSLFPANAKMVKDNFDGKNLKKVFHTKAGIEIALSDDKGKESITAVTPKGLTMVLEDENESITVSDKSAKNILKIDSKNGKMKIEAKTNISIKAGKCEIKLDGNSGTISIKCDKLDIKANQQATVASQQMMTIQGNILKAEGKQTAQFKGGAMAELSGGMVKIN